MKIRHGLSKENRNMATTIAVVEDNPEFMRHFVGIIEADSDFALAGVAATGNAAIELINRGRADLYLVDLGLPDMSGIEVIRLAVETYPDSEVMVISVFGDEQHVIESIEAGATGYLLKDSSAQQIAASIRTLLGGDCAQGPAALPGAEAAGIRAAGAGCSSAGRGRYIERARAADTRRSREGIELQGNRRGALHFSAYGGTARQEHLPQADRALTGRGSA